MITLIKGRIHSIDFVPKGPDPKMASITVMTGEAIGYELTFTVADGRALETRFVNGAKEVFAWVRWMWSESGGPKLFGFLDERQRSFFDRLVELDGVGGGRAIEIAGAIDEKAFTALAVACNINALKKLPGIGAKGAEKIVQVWK